MPDTTSLLLTVQVLEEFETVSVSVASFKDQPSRQFHVQFTLHISLGECQNKVNLPRFPLIDQYSHNESTNAD
jgi:hypothetical protein